MTYQTPTMKDSNKTNPVFAWLTGLFSFNDVKDPNSIKHGALNAESDSVQLDADESRVLVDAIKENPEPSNELLSLFK